MIGLPHRSTPVHHVASCSVRSHHRWCVHRHTDLAWQCSHGFDCLGNRRCTHRIGRSPGSETLLHRGEVSDYYTSKYTHASPFDTVQRKIGMQSRWQAGWRWEFAKSVFFPTGHCCAMSCCYPQH